MAEKDKMTGKGSNKKGEKHPKLNPVIDDSNKRRNAILIPSMVVLALVFFAYLGLNNLDVLDTLGINPLNIFDASENNSSVSTKNAISGTATLTALAQQKAKETGSATHVNSTGTVGPPPTRTPWFTPAPTFPPPPDGFVSMPDLIGLEYEEAEKIIRRKGLNFSISYYYNILDMAVEPGLIMKQDPVPGSHVNEDTIIKLYRSHQPTILYPSDNQCAISLLLYNESGTFEWAAFLEPNVTHTIWTNFSHGRNLNIKNSSGQIIDSFNLEGNFSGKFSFTVPELDYYSISIPYKVDYSLFGTNKVTEADLQNGRAAGCLGLLEN